MALCTMRLNVESVLRQFNSNQLMGASDSANSDYIGPLRRCGEALLSTIPIVCDEAHCLAEACLSQAVEGLIDAIVGRAQKKHVTSASKLPSWCCDSKDPPAAKEIDTTSVTDAVKAYCEALQQTFAVTEARSLRPPQKGLSARLPSHLRETTVEIERLVARIRASLSCGGGANWLSPASLLDSVRQELDRLTAQAEAADLSPHSHATTSHQLRVVADDVLKAAKVLIDREVANVASGSPPVPNVTKAATPMKRANSGHYSGLEEARIVNVPRPGSTTPPAPRKMAMATATPLKKRLNSGAEDIYAPAPSERTTKSAACTTPLREGRATRRSRSEGKVSPVTPVKVVKAGKDTNVKRKVTFNEPKWAEAATNRERKELDDLDKQLDKLDQQLASIAAVKTGASDGKIQTGAPIVFPVKQASVQAGDPLGDPQYSNKVAAVVSLKGILSNWFF